MARRLTLLFVCMVCWSHIGTANADEVIKNRGVLSAFHNGGLAFDAGVAFNYRVDFRLWSLMQEPVYSVHFTWTFDERARIGTTLTSSMAWSEDYPVGGAYIDNVPPEVRSKIVPYDVMVRIDGHLLGDPNQRYWVRWDVGVPGSSGSISYNTPTSKNWNELFIPIASESGSHYVNEDEAKRIMKTGFIATAVRIVQIKWQLDDYERYNRKQYPPQKTYALGRAIERHIELIEGLQGLPVEKLKKKLEDAKTESKKRRADGDSNFQAPLEKLVAKLKAGLPAPMRNPNVEARYVEALADIEANYNKTLKNAETTWLFAGTYDSWRSNKIAEIKARKLATQPMAVFWEDKPKEGKRCGFNDELGNLMIPAHYTNCSAIENGLAIVRADSTGSGVIDNSDTAIIPLEHYSVELASAKDEHLKFKVVTSVVYEGFCETAKQIFHIQMMDENGQNIGSPFTDVVDRSYTCGAPLILRSGR